MPGHETLLNRHRHRQLSVNSDRIASETPALSEIPPFVNYKELLFTFFGSLDIKWLPLHHLRTRRKSLGTIFGRFREQCR
jgi:hypothetical protein